MHCIWPRPQFPAALRFNPPGLQCGETNWHRGAAARARRTQPSIGEIVTKLPMSRSSAIGLVESPGRTPGALLCSLDRKSGGGVAALVVQADADDVAPEVRRSGDQGTCPGISGPRAIT